MTDTGHILVVDDEPHICALVERCLTGVGFRASSASCGADMKDKIAKGDVDLVILDLMLQGEDGLDLLRDIRTQNRIPVIILTGMGETADMVIGLELGADDYISKPFEPRELRARVRSVLRRAKDQVETVPRGNDISEMRFAGWVLDRMARKLTNPEGIESPLTAAQFDLLTALASHPNRVLNRDQLLDFARGRESSPFDRSIDVHIGHLRQKIEPDPKEPTIIKTVYGAGYIFTPTVIVS
jgi:two-component system, OmpR family, response regulator